VKVILRAVKKYAEEILDGGFFSEKMLKCQSFYVLFIFNGIYPVVL
jgi:hypothetical protein